MNETLIKKGTLGDEVLEIHRDESPESPREWDNVGTMACFHRRFKLGDKHEFLNSADLIKFIKRNNNKLVVLPLYLYDHSGISISTKSFVGRSQHGRWDSGQVGYIYVSYEDIRKRYTKQRVSLKLHLQITEYLKGEVKVYDQYLRNDVHGFMLIKLTTCDKCGDVEEENIHSCWGFYGDIKESGLYEHLEDKWRDVELKEVN